MERALGILEQVLGLDHPDTASSLSVLGEVLHAQGETAQARNHLEQALAIFNQRLGPRHPDTARTLQMLAALDAAPRATEQGSRGEAAFDPRRR